MFSWFILGLSLQASATLKSMAVGTVKGEVITSRDVQIQQILEIALYKKDLKSGYSFPSMDSKAFAKMVQETLLESAIALEAQNFKVVQVGEEDVHKLEREALAAAQGNSAWKAIQVSAKELKKGLIRKAQAKKFIQFRAQSSVLPITDSEALKYFNENRLKFGDLPYENFKENIKSYLSRTQVERRLQDWYEVLLNKYQVKNMLAEI